MGGKIRIILYWCNSILYYKLFYTWNSMPPSFSQFYPSCAYRTGSKDHLLKKNKLSGLSLLSLSILLTKGEFVAQLKSEHNPCIQETDKKQNKFGQMLEHILGNGWNVLIRAGNTLTVILADFQHESFCCYKLSI